MKYLPIDKDIPIPIEPEEIYYPLDQMEIGDSFFTTDSSITVFNTIKLFQKTHTKQFAIHSNSDFVSKGGWRVWRTA